MAKIFYSLSGEGRGHATRTRAIIEKLRQQHEITLFAPGDAYDLLHPAFRDSAIHVIKIPGLRFFYTSSGRLDFLKTAAGAFRYLLKYHKLRKHLDRYFLKHRPDLIITDFEPSLPRAARRNGIPFISLNHQHFLIISDLSSLPLYLRFHAFMMSLVVRSYHPKPDLTIASSFYFPPVLPRHRDAIQVGVILRPAVLEAKPERGKHVTAYLRRFAPDNVIRALKNCGREVRLYGLGKKERDGNIIYHDISEVDFLRDLASCDALVATAGNQLLGEALYLGKPVLAMPEPNNHEQYINAHFLEREGVGKWHDMEKVSTSDMIEFLDNLDTYRSQVDHEKIIGNKVALHAVERFLSQR